MKLPRVKSIKIRNQEEDLTILRLSILFIYHPQRSIIKAILNHLA